MKKFNTMIILTIIMYGVLAGVVGCIVLSYSKQSKDHNYRVESNRLIKDLENERAIDLREYSFIKEISFLEIQETKKEKINHFFIEDNERKSFVQPIFQNDKLTGYVKILYEETNRNIIMMVVMVEIGLLITFLLIIWLLIYLKYNVIDPFNCVMNLPEDLAKGHYKSEIKIEKSKYFKQFLLGMEQLKKELDISRKRQLELLKEKKQILLSLSHDIKTPLNLIKLYARSLEEEIYVTKEEKIGALKQIEEKTIEIDHYVDEITNSFREEILDLPVEMTELYLNTVLDKVLKMYQQQCYLRHINFTVEEYENRIIKGDGDRLQEVLENLFENAIKYGDGKEITVTFSEEDYCYLIHIYNTGNAVMENELVHLFDSFYRGTNAKGKQGSGLGLYISKQLMNKMDGEIYIENKENGMMCTIVLP